MTKGFREFAEAFVYSWSGRNSARDLDRDLIRDFRHAMGGSVWACALEDERTSVHFKSAIGVQFRISALSGRPKPSAVKHGWLHPAMGIARPGEARRIRCRRQEK